MGFSCLAAVLDVDVAEERERGDSGAPHRPCKRIREPRVSLNRSSRLIYRPSMLMVSFPSGNLINYEPLTASNHC
jgi:hypothetical protein